VTRVNLGVQQLDPELLTLRGRKQNATHVLAMGWRCRELGLACNVDLIYGWARQTVTHSVRVPAPELASLLCLKLCPRPPLKGPKPPPASQARKEKPLGKSATYRGVLSSSPA
jgi:hypothetical protein